MFNIYSHIVSDRRRQFTCGESLITLYTCGLQNKYQDMWSHHNYIVYVMEGRKIWHTQHGSHDLREGACVFVRKGANIVEQFFDGQFCLFLFFIPDDFICEVLKGKSTPLFNPRKKFDTVVPVENSPSVQAFFQSMIPHFNNNREPDETLLQLKFRELILTIADNPDNPELLSMFSMLLQEPQAVSLQRVMEDNFCYNLKLEDYAKLCSRSLSAFKRDFIRIFNTTPGKWLMEKRLNYALQLLTNMGKTVAETSFESGFENASHFSRAFRLRYGHSPAAIKNKQISI